MGRRLVWALLATIASCGTVEAQSACEQFNWPVRREVEWLSSSNLTIVTNGGERAGDGPFILALQPMLPSVAYSNSPQRAPKTLDSFGGTMTIVAPSRAGIYQVTLNDEAWIDVVQNGHRVSSNGVYRQVGLCRCSKERSFRNRIGTDGHSDQRGPIGPHRNSRRPCNVAVADMSGSTRCNRDCNGRCSRQLVNVETNFEAVTIGGQA